MSMHYAICILFPKRFNTRIDKNVSQKYFFQTGFQKYTFYREITIVMLMYNVLCM